MLELGRESCASDAKRLKGVIALNRIAPVWLRVLVQLNGFNAGAHRCSSDNVSCFMESNQLSG
jgi:hypothetical protein